MKPGTRLSLLSVLLIAPALGATAEPRGAALAGPIPAVVEQVIDGDTVRVRARIWLAQELLTDVRLRGIDAPEMNSRCDAERDRAREAKAWLDARIAGRTVSLSDISGDKYGGRVVARIITAQGDDIGAALLAHGLARPYRAGRKGTWCDN